MTHEPDVLQIRREILADGYAAIAGFLDDATLEQLKQYVEGEVERHEDGYIGGIGLPAVEGTALAELSSDAEFLELLRAVHTAVVGRAPAQDADLYQVLRVIVGPSGIKYAHTYHYDAYVITALVPICTPDRADGKNGDLILFRRRRRLHTSLVLNLLQKALIQNPLSRYLLTVPSIMRLMGAVKVKLSPGSLYLFLGYQTCHGNLVCAPEALRATALFHYADPFKGNRLIKRLESYNAPPAKLRDGSQTATRKP